MKDTFAQSAARGRVLGGIIMGLVSLYLGSKGIALSKEDSDAWELAIASMIGGMSSAIVFISKMREKP